MTRRFLLFSERRSLELRGEAFNLANHTQFSSIDTTARFDNLGHHALFPESNAARRQRFINLGLKVNF